MYPAVYEQSIPSFDGCQGQIHASEVPNTVAAMHFHASAGSWSTGLCHCFDDPQICFITCFCPCITFGQIAEIVNRRSPSCVRCGTVYALLALTGCPCLFSCFYRSVLRAQYDLEESPCPDCLVHFCCEACALCQEHRQLRKMGFDMGIGWEANLDRQRRGVMASPRLEPGMTR
ncbi:hypothetical protein K2173_002316 [Erythroxylum novogranatense]|uniref:POS2 n=1 Tax=Erythroxylum novogranatense TaxID=1862640 RepID=A0AAV8TB80_9ROSI|nr:hypothetical protein K2173_002316 [Erythroxylum novogranatense]